MACDSNITDVASLCINCQEPIKLGQVLLCWDDVGEMHANCDDPFSLTPNHKSDGNPYPVVLLGSPALRIPLSVVQTIPDPSEHELLEKSKEVLVAFAEGVEWSDDQRKAYTDLHTAVSRFKPILSKFQPLR